MICQIYKYTDKNNTHETKVIKISVLIFSVSLLRATFLMYLLVSFYNTLFGIVIHFILPS